MDKIPLIAVVGPTASGKTALSVEIAKMLGGEIVSADSMQLYKYMDIGTAKVTKEEMRGIKHYLIDEVDPSVNFSTAQFCSLAHKYIEEIHKKGKTAVVVGGTGLYVQSLVDDVEFIKEEIDYEARAELERLADEKGNEYLIEILREFDSVSAERLHPNNRRRVIRAIEFYRAMGFPISEHQENTQQAQSRYRPLMLGIDMDRAVLYERINRRVDIMIENGLFDEVKKLMSMGYTRDTTAMQGIGYKEVMNYFRGFSTKAESVELLKRNSRRYAKRQLTWFRRDKRVQWLKYDDNLTKNAFKAVEEFLK